MNMPPSPKSDEVSAAALPMKTSGLAIASLSLSAAGLLTGCLGIGILLGLTGLILGIVALTRIGKPQYPGRGKGLALAGTVLGGLAITLGPVALMMVAILLPALSAARQTAREMQTVSQARSIHQEMVFHAANHSNQMPEDIGLLLAQHRLSADHLISPFSPQPIPSDFHAWPEDQQQRWMRQHASFVLVPGAWNLTANRSIVLFVRPDHASPRGIVVAYSDHTAELEENIAAIEQQLQQQTGQTLQDLIDRQIHFSPPTP